MKKGLKIFLIFISLLIVTAFCLGILFFEDVYESRYSSGNSDARTVSVIINNAIENNQIALTDDNSVVYGRMNHDKVYVTSVNGQNTDIVFNAESETGYLYWAVSVEDRKVDSAWVCKKDLLDDEKLIPYEYGEQKNFVSAYGRRFIGYYSSDETTTN